MMSLLFTRRLFLAALKNLRAGELTLITPEKETWHFVGKESGIAADLTLHDWGVIKRFLLQGEEALAEDHAEGKWETDNMSALLALLAEHAALFENSAVLKWRRKWIDTHSQSSHG